mmetsp:Transcript_24199/g.57679  ORF Transcript_24199/g.57679 Transcript_24199/m.57679 type:complete len:235 (+) Transcript_24199:1104-1808(+)
MPPRGHLICRVQPGGVTERPVQDDAGAAAGAPLARLQHPARVDLRPQLRGLRCDPDKLPDSRAIIRAASYALPVPLRCSVPPSLSFAGVCKKRLRVSRKGGKQRRSPPCCSGERAYCNGDGVSDGAPRAAGRPHLPPLHLRRPETRARGPRPRKVHPATHPNRLHGFQILQLPLGKRRCNPRTRARRVADLARDVLTASVSAGNREGFPEPGARLSVARPEKLRFMRSDAPGVE